MQMNRYVFRSGRQADSQTYVENACFFWTLALHEYACRGPNNTDTQHALVIMHEREKCVCVWGEGETETPRAKRQNFMFLTQFVVLKKSTNALQLNLLFLWLLC